MQLKVISTLAFVGLAAALALPPPSENLLPPHSNTLRPPPETDALPVRVYTNANTFTPGQDKVMIKENYNIHVPRVNSELLPRKIDVTVPLARALESRDLYMDHRDLPGGAKTNLRLAAANIAVSHPVNALKC
jgi:hypothetical protein